MPGPERNKLNPVPCRIPSFDRVRTIAPPREPTPPGAQASQCHEIAYALQRVSKVRRQFKQASQSLQESCANDAFEIEKLRRVQQETFELMLRTAEDKSCLTDQTRETNFDDRDNVSVRSCQDKAESPKRRMGQGSIASAESADDGSKFHNLQDAYRKLELKHAQAQNRIKQLELLVRGRWEEAPAEGVDLAATSGSAQATSQAAGDKPCVPSVQRSAQGYRAMAARLAEEVVQFAADFKQADNEADHAADRRRFVFWAEHQVAPFLPTLE